MSEPAGATPISWATDVNGSFNDGTKWVGGVVPGASDDVTINTGTAGTPDTVTSSANNTINSLTTGAHDALVVSGGTAFTITNGGTNAGTISAANNAVLQIGGTETNSGAITVNGGANTTDLHFADGTTLTGGGAIILSDSASNRIFGITNSGAETVTNVNNTISGAGQFGVSASLEFINQAAGTINASGTNALVVTPTTNVTAVAAHGGGFVNQGLMEATNTGGLVLVGSTFDNTGGTIKAVGSGHSVYFESSTTIVGGTLNGSGGGLVEVATGHAVTLDGSTHGQITIQGTYLGSNNSTTSVTGTLNNTGIVSLAGAANTTDLHLGDGTLLTGGGTIALSDATTNRVFGIANSGAETVTNFNNTISGAGQFGVSGSFEFINQASGVINASGVNALIVTPTANTTAVAAHGGGFVNQGLMEATNSGGLVLNGGTFNNNGGTIRAAGSGNNVYLQSNVTVAGGTLISSGGGEFVVVTGNEANLDGVTQGAISLVTNFLASNNTTTEVSGAFVNQATFTLNAGANTTDLRFSNGTMLTGGGIISLSDSANNRIFGITDSGAETVTNVNNTIQGAGQLGVSGSFEFINQATINANGTASLVVSPTTNAAMVAANGGGFVNQNLMEATNTGGLVLNGGVFNNSAGTIKAVGSGNNVYLQSNVTVVGGALTATGGGLFEGAAGNTVNLDGATHGQITLTGGYVANNNSTTFVTGTFNNLGTMTVNSTANITDLRFADGATLTGGGTIALSDNPNNRIFGIANSGTEVLTNVDNTIQGAGQFGVSASLKIVNGGTIDASGTNALIIAPTTNGAVGTQLVNQAGGVLEGSGAGGLSITQGTVDNQGSVLALNGSSVTYQPFATTLNNSGGTLTGGTWGAFSSGGGATVSINGTPVVTDAANIVLSGAGSVFQVRNGTGTTFTPLENSLTTIASTGQLQILNNRDYTANTGTNDISNAGSLALGGGTFTSKDIMSSGLVIGFGTVTTTSGTQLANSGLVRATGGTLKVTPGISGSSGNITIDSGAGLNLSSATTGSQVATLTDSGALNLGSHNITVFADYNNTNFGVGNSFNKHANVTTTGGQILASGTTSQTLSGTAITGGGTATAGLSFGNVHVGTPTTLNYQVNNVGTGGPAMRFAIETSVNGGNITDPRLSGSGVTPSNLGPVAQGSSTGVLGVTFTPTSAGALTGQTIHIANNFDNVGEQSIGVSGTAYNLASSSTIAPISFGLHHVGDGPVTQNLTITNTAPAGSFSEGLDSSFGSFTGTGGSKISTSGSVTNLAAGSTNSSSMTVTLDTSTVGTVNGTLTVHQASNGSGTSGLGITALADQNPAVTAQVATGTVVRFASPQINNAPISFGNVRVGTAVTPQGVSITNNVPNDGFSESLIGNVVGTSNSQVTASGGFGPPSANPELAPAATDTTSITAAIDTSSAGAKSGNAIIDFKSDGTAFSGGTVTDLGNTNVAVQGNVYRLSSPTLNTPSVTMAARVGDASPTAAVSVTNTSPDSFTEGLDAGISTSSAGFTASGAITNLAAQGSDASSLKVGVDTSTSGTFSGSAKVAYTSNGLIDGATPVSAGSGTVGLTGKVYQTAVASVSPGPLNFGIVHVGDTVASQSINVANTASGALTDVITGNIGSVTGGAFTSSGTLGAGVAAGSNSNALQVGLNTSTAGVYSGQANLSLQSHDADLSDVHLATTPEAISAQINNYAKGAIKDTGGAGSLSGAGASYLLDFGTVTQGSGTKVADLAVKNDVSGPADALAGTFTVPGLPGDLTLSGFTDFTGLAAGASDSGLMASFDTSFAPSFFDVFVTLDLTGSNASGYDAALPTDPTVTLELRGKIVSGGSNGNSVPEPGTLLLLVGGLAGLFGASRKRHKGR